MFSTHRREIPKILRLVPTLLHTIAGFSVRSLVKPGHLAPGKLCKNRKLLGKWIVCDVTLENDRAIIASYILHAAGCYGVYVL